MVIQWDFIGIQWDINGIYPLVMINIAMLCQQLAIENGPFEIVDFPIKNVIFHGDVQLPEGMSCCMLFFLGGSPVKKTEIPEREWHQLWLCHGRLGIRLRRSNKV